MEKKKSAQISFIPSFYQMKFLKYLLLSSSFATDLISSLIHSKSIYWAEYFQSILQLL